MTVDLDSATGESPVACAMHTFPKTCGPATTVACAREGFRNPKVHVLLVVDGDLLIAVVDRADLHGRADGEPIAALGRLNERVVRPSDPLQATWAAMTEAGCRRVAVVGDDGRLVGLLCLKRSGRGFCSDAGIRARAVEAAAGSATGAAASVENARSLPG